PFQSSYTFFVHVSLSAFFFSFLVSFFFFFFFFFFFNDTATTEIYTLSLHDALPISRGFGRREHVRAAGSWPGPTRGWRSSRATRDRKSTRLNSSHVKISYAVFCLKKKKKKTK